MFSFRQFLFIALLLATTGILGWWMGRSTVSSAPVSVRPLGARSLTIQAAPLVPQFSAEEAAARLASRLMQRDRLGRTEEFLHALRGMDLPTLQQLSHTLLRQEKLGYDLSLERQLLLFRLGQLAGPETIQQKFTTDADVGIHVNGIVLEGWATSAPTQALDWWRSLPGGKMRESLLTPLMQGLLYSDQSSWQLLAESFLPGELNKAAIPLMESVLHAQGPEVALAWFERVVLTDISEAVRRHLAERLNQAMLNSESLDLLLRWQDFSQQYGNHPMYMSVASMQKVVARIGALGGASVMEKLGGGRTTVAGLSIREAHSLARGWVRAKPDAAAAWVEKNKAHPRCSAVAFQLALLGVSENPRESTRWLEFMDEEQKPVAESIIAKYMAAADSGAAPPDAPQGGE